MAPVLRNAMGQEVRNGDILNDFRGRQWRFRYLTSGAVSVSHRKLVVEPVSGGGFAQEFFPSVFPTLTIEEA